MLAALNYGAVFAGIAGGGLVASILALGLSSLFELAGVETGSDIGWGTCGNAGRGCGSKPLSSDCET